MPPRKQPPNKSQQDVALAVLRQFRVVFGSVRQHFREVEETCGITGSQLWLLQEISRDKGIGVSELAVRLSIHQSTCSQLVERLVKAGLIVKTRSTEDQRRVGLMLSPEAKKTLKCAPGPAEGMLPEALKSLPEVALRTLHVNLAELIDRLHQKDVQDAGTPLADL